MKLEEGSSPVATLAGFEVDDGFRLLADAMPHMVWVSRASGWWEFVNERAATYVGSAPEELLGEGWSRFVHPEDLAGFRSAWKRSVGKNVPLRAQYRIRRGDGLWRWFEAHAHPRLDRPGGEPLWFGTSTDIHERHEAEEASGRVRRRLEATLDNAHVAICYLTPDGWLSSCNGALLRLAGLRAEDVAGRRVHFEDLFPGAPCVDLHGAAQLMPFECELARARDERVPVIVTVEPLADDDQLVVFVLDLTAQRRVARLLQESERRLHQALELAPLPTGIVAEDGEILLINKVCRDVLGYDPSDLPNVGVWSQVAYPRARPEVLQRVGDLFALEGPSDEGEHRVRARTGDIRLWHFHVAPIGRSRDGRRQLVVMATDITDQRRAEREAHEGARRLRAYFRAANVGFAEIRPGTMRYVDVNDTFCGLLGRSREDLLTLDVFSVTHPDDPVLGAPAEHLRAASPERPQETRYVRPDGSVVWVLAHVSPVTDGEGRVRSLFTTAVDITSQRRAMDALMVSEHRFRMAASASRVMVYELLLDRDPSASGASASRPAAFETHGSLELLGVEPHLLRDVEQWRERLHPDDVLDWLAGRQRLVEQGGDLASEYRVWHQDGHWVHVLDRGRIERQPPEDAAEAERGGAGRIVGTIIEITDLKRYEEALQRADRHKNEFITMLGHELRNPLAAMRYAAQLQRSVPAQDDRLRRSTEVIDRQTALMSRLLDDLLDVSRIERGKIHLERGLVDLVEVVRHVVDDQQPVVRSRGLRLEEHLPTERIWVDADRTRLAQAVGNLVSNALKFTDAPGRIAVGVGVEGGMAWLEVSDTGIGVDPAFLPHIFEPFQQGGSHRQGDGGLGLGLSLVRGIAELHGGSVEVHSDGPGKGSRFVVRLPCHAGPAEAPGTFEEVALPRRVLLVEDNPDSAEVLRDLLEIAGYVVRVAHDGPTALRIQRQFQAEVILCDIGLPGGMSGYDVARKVREEQQDPPLLVALTGYGGDVVRAEAVDAGFHLHLTKPVDVEEIVQLVEDLSKDR